MKIFPQSVGCHSVDSVLSPTGEPRGSPLNRGSPGDSCPATGFRALKLMSCSCQDTALRHCIFWTHICFLGEQRAQDLVRLELSFGEVSGSSCGSQLSEDLMWELHSRYPEGIHWPVSKTYRHVARPCRPQAGGNLESFLGISWMP